MHPAAWAWLRRAFVGPRTPELSVDGRGEALLLGLCRRLGRRRLRLGLLLLLLLLLGDRARLEHRHLTISRPFEDDEGRGRQRGLTFGLARLACCLALGDTLLAQPFALFLPSLASGFALCLPFGAQALPLLESREATGFALLLALLAQGRFLCGARPPAPRWSASLALGAGARHLGRTR